MIRRQINKGTDQTLNISSNPISKTPVRWGNLNPGHYEVAWFLNINDQIQNSDTNNFYTWLIKQQNLDGSWGYPADGPKSKFISTFKILESLKKKYDSNTNSVILSKGYEWLFNNVFNLENDWQDPIGYEMLIGSQLIKAENFEIDLNLNYPYLKKLKKNYEKKLEYLINSDFKNSHLLAHSCEFLESQESVDELVPLMAINGSMCNSPSATAFILSNKNLNFGNRKRAKLYLEFVCKENLFPVKIFPLDLVEVMGVLLYSSMDNRFQIENSMDLIERLLINFKSNLFVPAASTFPIVDLDDTFIGHILVNKFGFDNVKFPNIEKYECENYYSTYLNETDLSLSTQIHALWYAVLSKDEKIFNKSLNYLQNIHSGNEFMNWSDKFVPSPWYSILHLILALSEYIDENLWTKIIDKVVHWIRTKQNQNGSFGVFRENDNTLGTIDETAQVLLIIETLGKKWNIIFEKILVSNAIHYIQQRLINNLDNSGPTWMGKAGLFISKPILESTLISSLSNIHSLIKKKYTF